MEDKKMKPVRVSGKKRNDNQIHLREKNKGEWVKRSMNGFGKPKYALSNMIRYAVDHMNDSVGVSLKDADSLIKCIADNRMVLATFEADFRRIIEEINRLGNNVNQIAKKINLLMLKAEENGTEVSEQCRELLQFRDGTLENMAAIRTLIKGYKETVVNDKNAISDILLREDELLTRCLVFPPVGDFKVKVGQLLRALQDYIGNNSDEYNNISIEMLMDELEYNYINKEE